MEKDKSPIAMVGWVATHREGRKTGHALVVREGEDDYSLACGSKEKWSGLVYDDPRKASLHLGMPCYECAWALSVLPKLESEKAMKLIAGLSGRKRHARHEEDH